MLKVSPTFAVSYCPDVADIDPIYVGKVDCRTVVESSCLMSVVRWSDSDFRVCHISFDTLLEIQIEAESRGWATRWSSVQALRSQVKQEPIFLQSLMREEYEGTVRAYRCLVLFSTYDSDNAGAMTTIDLDPARFHSLERLDHDPHVRKALAQFFSLATNGISMTSKK